MALINLRNALMGGKRLPYDAEVEYLESTGTQWIDTGVYGNETSEVTLDVQVLQLGYSKAAFGAFGSSNRSIYLYQAGTPNPNNWQVGFGGYTNVGTKNTDRHVFAFSNFTVRMDGTQIASFAVRTFTTPQTLLLFNMHNDSGGTYDSVSTRIYSCKIWDNNVLVRDYIPVRKGAVGYLYDRVSGKLFGNAGTGDFVLGQDVVPVEYIESHGTEWIDTGVYGSQSLRTTFDYQLMYSGTAPVAEGLFGCYANGMKYYLYCSGVAPSYFQVGMGSGYINTILVDDVRHSIEFNNGTVSIDGNVVATFNPFEYPTAYTLLLFALRNSSGGLYSMTPMRKWRVQMWDNGTPVRSFYSVRVGTDATSWEGAMMDVLTRRIYRNAGTGAFGYGNDLKYPIPAE